MSYSFDLALGIDYGMAKIGLAIGQQITKSATPLKQIKAKQGIPSWSEFELILKKWNPDTIVIGMPLNMEGKTQYMSRKTNIFCEMIKQKYNIPIFKTDERLTTKEARSLIFEEYGYKGLTKYSIDSFCAKLILEQWMNDETQKY
jgi:putative Holliday junction resolvase